MNIFVQSCLPTSHWANSDCKVVKIKLADLPFECFDWYWDITEERNEYPKANFS